nr:MAG TPA: hypothetical protein [Caudoviricetes sp.]
MIQYACSGRWYHSNACLWYLQYQGHFNFR